MPQKNFRNIFTSPKTRLFGLPRGKNRIIVGIFCRNYNLYHDATDGWTNRRTDRQTGTTALSRAVARQCWKRNQRVHISSVKLFLLHVLSVIITYVCHVDTDTYFVIHSSPDGQLAATVMASLSPPDILHRHSISAYDTWETCGRLR